MCRKKCQYFTAIRRCSTNIFRESMSINHYNDCRFFSSFSLFMYGREYMSRFFLNFLIFLIFNFNSHLQYYIYRFIRVSDYLAPNVISATWASTGPNWWWGLRPKSITWSVSGATRVAGSSYPVTSSRSATTRCCANTTTTTIRVWTAVAWSAAPRGKWPFSYRTTRTTTTTPRWPTTTPAAPTRYTTTKARIPVGTWNTYYNYITQYYTY